MLSWVKKRIKEILHTKESKVLVSNFFSLSLLQVVNYTLPLVTLPYLVRVLGYERFGLLAFSTATVSYFQIFTEYGFNLSATKEISIHRNDQEKLSEIFSSVMTIKVLFTFLSLSILAFLIITFDLFRGQWLVYLLTFGVVVGQTFLPVWFFQGLEKMKYITFFNIVAKLIFALAIFIFVKTQQDYYWVPLLTSVGYLLVAMWSLFIVVTKFNVVLKIPSRSIIIYHLQSGWYIFVSNIAVSLYTMTTTVILGLITNNIIVGYYSVADRLITAIKGVNGPVAQALYPFINRKVLISKEDTLLFLKKLLVGVGLIMGIVSLFIFVFSKELIDFLFGSASFNSVVVLRILSLVPFLVAMDTILGTLTMLVFNRNKQYSYIIISAGFLNLFVSCFLIKYWEHVGAAISVLIVEVYITFRLFLYVQRNNLNLI